jgi:hypothetical protein
MQVEQRLRSGWRRPSATLLGCTTGGEIAPSEISPYSDLRNRTMTITTIGEA